MSTATTAEAHPNSHGTGPTASGRLIALMLAALGVALLLAVGMLLGRYASGASAPRTDGADAGFARDMGTHHAQAVEMAEIVRSRTTDPQIRTLATEIALTQTEQIGEMRGWLAVWRLPPGSTAAPMSWMADAGMRDMPGMSLLPDGRMPGMATAEQIAQLRDLPPPEADRVFLQLMVEHHGAGIAMATTGRTLATSAAARELAVSIANAQTLEIEQFRQLLAARGGA
ncbi:MAG: DUF305 domain-containing protein [Sporichthyaceae bacterium]